MSVLRGQVLLCLTCREYYVSGGVGSARKQTTCPTHLGNATSNPRFWWLSLSLFFSMFVCPTCGITPPSQAPDWLLAAPRRGWADAHACLPWAQTPPPKKKIHLGRCLSCSAGGWSLTSRSQCRTWRGGRPQAALNQLACPEPPF